MDLNKTYQEIDMELEEIGKGVTALLNSKYCDEQTREEELDKVSQLLVDVGVLLFRSRKLSWDMGREYQKMGEPAALQHSVLKLKEELRENGFALNQFSVTLQERVRSLRSIIMSSQG